MKGDARRAMMACCGGFLAASSFGVAVPLDAMGPVRVKRNMVGGGASLRSVVADVEGAVRRVSRQAEGRAVMAGQEAEAEYRERLAELRGRIRMLNHEDGKGAADA